MKMRRISIILCLLLAALSLVSCLNGRPRASGNTESEHDDRRDTVGEQVSVPLEPLTEGKSYSFSAYHKKTYWDLDMWEITPVTVIRSMDDLRAFFAEDGPRPEMYAPCNRYDDAFFEDHVVFMLHFVEGSGGNRHEVTDVVRAEDGWVVCVNRDSSGLTGDMAYWAVLVEVEIDEPFREGETVEVRVHEVFMIPYAAHTFTVFGGPSPMPKTAIVRSCAELEALFPTGGVTSDMQTLFQSYDEAWFERNALVLWHSYEGSPAATYGVLRVIKDQGRLVMELVRELPPHDVDFPCVMTNYFVFLEVNRLAFREEILKDDEILVNIRTVETVGTEE